MPGGDKLTEAQRRALKLLSELPDQRMGWHRFWNGRAGIHRMTAGALADRGLVEQVNYLWDGSDYEFWCLTDAGRAALTAPTVEN